jgi:hypothetical protein
MLRIKQKIKFIKPLIKFFILISIIEIIYLIIKINQSFEVLW